MKRCSKCKSLKPLTAFTKRYNTKDGLAYWCKDCKKKSRAGYRKTSQGKIATKTKNLRDKYGITFFDYLSMYNRQNGKCLICGNKNGNRDLHVDHDHVTGKVRGLLCSTCNAMLGSAKDNPEILAKGIAYLKSNS